MEGNTAARIGVGIFWTAAGFVYGYRQERIASLSHHFNNEALEEILTGRPDDKPPIILDNLKTERNTTRTSVALGAGFAGICYISSGNAVNAVGEGMIGGGLHYAGAYLGKRAAVLVPDRKELSVSQRGEMDSKLEAWVKASIHDESQASDVMKDTVAYMVHILKNDPSVNLAKQIVQALEDANSFVFHYNLFNKYWQSPDSQVFIAPSRSAEEQALFLIPHEKKLYEMTLDGEVCRQADGFAHENVPACQEREWDSTLDSYVRIYMDESKKRLTVALFSEDLSLQQKQEHAISYFEASMHNSFRSFTKLVDTEFRGR